MNVLRPRSSRRPAAHPGMLLPVLAVASLALLLLGCDRAPRPTEADPFARARYRIERLMERQGIASFQVAAARDGKILYAEAFGWADFERTIPTTTETRHLVASIDKPFTSTALMILTERGKLDLDRPLNDYLGEAKLIAYRGDAAEATIARLMLHTSGLPSGYYICGDEVPADKRRSNDDLLALAGVLASRPGTRFEYSNLGYGLLGDVVRQAAGVPVKQFIQDEVIAPLGLAHTGYFRSVPPAGTIASQNVEAGALPVAFDAEGYTALYSTAGDLARFGMFHLKAALPDQKPVLSEAGRDLLWQRHESAVEATTRRLGWDVQQDFGFETVQHGGGGPGIHNWLYMIPSEKLVVAILSNARYSNRHIDPVLVELIAAALSPSGKERFRPAAGRGYARSTLIDPSSFRGRWVGRIEGPKGSCPVTVDFGLWGGPKLRTEGDPSAPDRWVAASGDVARGHHTLLWRFDARIPYLVPFAPHDEVILTIRPEGEKLVGTASAAKEKNFGRGENYVLPQFVELSRQGE